MLPSEKQRRDEGLEQDEAREAARKRLEKRRSSHVSSEKVDSESLDLAGHSATGRRRRADDERRVIEANRPGTSRSSEHRSSSSSAQSTFGAILSMLLQGLRWLVLSLASLGRSVLSQALSRPRAALACLLAIIVALAGISAIVRSCSPQETPAVVEEEPSSEDDSRDDQGDQADEPAEEADFSQLPATLDTQIVASLQAQAQDARIVKIVNSAQELAEQGEVLQIKLLKLVAKDSQAIDYVADYLDRYPESSGSAYEGSLSKGTIPDLKQWDQRWGYVEYCGSALGLTGCCPTSLSMVYMGLTGKTDKTPADMAALATDDGYAIDGSGTVGDFLIDEAYSLGLSCQYFYPSSQSLVWYLENGFTVIVNVGPGDFTESGHFFVARGVASDGDIEINDPYSSVNTKKTWDADVIASQSMAMYAFKAL